MKITGWVLAGGQSIRMGRNKALLELNGERLIARTIRTLSQVCETIAISGDPTLYSQFAPAYPDEQSGQGPLSGIITALTHSQTDWNLIVAVDLPNLTISWPQQLANHTAHTRASAVITYTTQPEPLVAAYHRSLLPGLQAALNQQRLKLTDAIASAGQIEWLQASPDQIETFRNVNTPEEFRTIPGQSASVR